MNVLENRRQWHLDQIELLTETITQHVRAIREIERMQEQPPLPGMDRTEEERSS